MEGFKTKNEKGVLCGEHSEDGRRTGDNDAGVGDDMQWLETVGAACRWETRVQWRTFAVAVLYLRVLLPGDCSYFSHLSI